VAGGEHADSLIMGEGRVAHKRGPLARGRAVARERERARLMGGVGLSARRGERGADGRERWVVWAVRSAREREGGGNLGRNRPSRGGGEKRNSLFFFSFPISKSILVSSFLKYPFSFKQIFIYIS
jgi:hypothetical protein